MLFSFGMGVTHCGAVKKLSKKSPKCSGCYIVSAIIEVDSVVSVRNFPQINNQSLLPTKYKRVARLCYSTQFALSKYMRQKSIVRLCYTDHVNAGGNAIGRVRPSVC